MNKNVRMARTIFSINSIQKFSKKPWNLDNIEWHNHYANNNLIACSLYFSRGKVLKRRGWLYIHKVEMVVDTLRGHQLSLITFFGRNILGHLIDAGTMTVYQYNKNQISIQFRNILTEKKTEIDLSIMFVNQNADNTNDIIEVINFLELNTNETVFVE